MKREPLAEMDLGPIERRELERRIAELESRAERAIAVANAFATRTGYSVAREIAEILQGQR